MNLPRQAQQPVTLKQILWAVGVPLAVIILSWGARSYDASKLDTSRFVTDSIVRANDRVILDRIDRRVRDMYCAGKPAGCQ